MYGLLSFVRQHLTNDSNRLIEKVLVNSIMVMFGTLDNRNPAIQEKVVLGQDEKSMGQAFRKQAT